MGDAHNRLRDRINGMRDSQGGAGRLPNGRWLPGFGPPMQRLGLARMAIGFAAANMFLCLCVLAVSALVGALAWPYAINEWLVFAGRPPAVEPLHGALIGLVPGFGQVGLPVAVVTWIAMLFLGG